MASNFFVELFFEDSKTRGHRSTAKIVKFIAKQKQPDCDLIIIATSRVEHRKAQDLSTTTEIHSYRGTTIKDLLEVVTQHPVQHISNVFLARLNDKGESKG